MLSRKLRAVAVPTVPLSVTPSAPIGDTSTLNYCQFVAITVSSNPAGGSPPYTYSWTKLGGDGDIVFGSTSENCTVRQYCCPNENFSGTYRITVTDSRGDTATADILVEWTGIA